jgi:pimeloyl-ACP methyl ester carboxylesterase
VSLPVQRLRVSGGELAYVEAGDGPAVVLLHGFPTSSFLWRDLQPVLSVGMRVVAPDLLGFGESEKPDASDLSLVAQAGYVRELTAALGIERFAAVGHGLGGGVAQRLAFDGGVDALVLIDSYAFDQWPSAGAAEVRDVPVDSTPEDIAALVRGWLEDTLVKRALTPPEVEGYVRPWREDPAGLIRAISALDGKGLEDAESALGALEGPTFVIWGEDDPYLPAALAERLGDCLPGSMVALLPGCGHLVTEDAPDTVVGLVSQFLRRQYLKEEHHHPHDGPVRVYLQRPSDPSLLGAEEESE